jgi:hypothetical protein
MLARKLLKSSRQIHEQQRPSSGQRIGRPSGAQLETASQSQAEIKSRRR